MFEHRRAPLVPRRVFLGRVARWAGWSFLIILMALGIGMVGYHVFEGLSWLDAFLNAAMILSGMGPANQLQTSAGKLFAGCYALFSGLTFVTAVSVLLAPLFHRFLHKFHLEADRERNDGN